MEQADSTRRRFHFSALAKAVACLPAFISQPAAFTLSQIYRCLNVNPATPSRGCGSLIDLGSRQQVNRKRYHCAPHPGRRTEIDFINGLVAVKGEEMGTPAPTHAAITRLVRQVERGEIDAHPRNVETL